MSNSLLLAMLGHLKLYVAFNLSLETLISRLKNIQLLIKRTSDGAEQIAKLQTLQEEIKAEAAEIKRELSAHTPMCLPSIVLLRRLMQRSKLSFRGCKRFKKCAETLKEKLDAAFRQDKENTSRIQASILQNLTDPNDGNPEAPDLGFLQRDNAQIYREFRQASSMI